MQRGSIEDTAKPHSLHKFSFVRLVTYTLWILKKYVTLLRVIVIFTWDFYTKKIGFKVLGDNIKVFFHTYKEMK